MISMDTLIVQMMNQAQRLVNADRASLFLVDNRSNQIYARIFDVSQDSSLNSNSFTNKEIRCSCFCHKSSSRIISKLIL